MAEAEHEVGRRDFHFVSEADHDRLTSDASSKYIYIYI